MLNRVRREHPALQWMRTLTIHDVDNPDVMCWSKSLVAADGSRDTVIVVVNLDPHGTREATVHLDMPAIGLDWNSRFTVEDQVTGQSFEWGAHDYVRLDPFHEPAHVLVVRSEQA
jgi:starch synthase (maltosyl-transferring)